MLSSRKYQQTLQKRRDYKARRKASTPSGQSQGQFSKCSGSRDAARSSAASGSDGDSVPGSVGPEDSTSQIPGSNVSPWDKSKFFKEFAAFLGFQEEQRYVSFPDMLSAMVAKEVEGRLAPNTTSLTAAPSLSVHGAVQSATNPPPGLGARQSVQSLLADVPAGGNREQERPGDELDLDQDVPSHDPLGGKRSRPPKDFPWKVKRSRPEVGGDLVHSLTGSPSGRGRGRDRRVCSEQRRRPQTLGEGPAVHLQGVLTEDSVKPTQLERGAIHAIPPAPSRSTRHTGAPGPTAASSYALYHHNQIHPVASHPVATGSGLGSLRDPGSPSLRSGVPGLPGVPSSGYLEDHGVDSSEEEPDTRVTRETVSPPIFHTMMEYIAQCFPEAHGYAEGSCRPVPPGHVKTVEDKRIRFTRAQPMDFSLEAATKALRCATEGSRPSLARYPSGRYRRIYGVSGHEFAGKAAKLNTDLALALTTKGKEPQVVVQHADMSRLEGTLARQREAQNFLFWAIGAFYRLFSSLQPDQEEKLLADQLFRSIQFAMVDTVQDSAFALTNVKAMRREAILSHLPPVFKSATKVDLRKSAIDSAFLFDEDRVKEALQVADKAASISFQQAAARALVKPRPATGTPLVDRGSRSASAGDPSHRAPLSTRRLDPSSRSRAPQHQRSSSGLPAASRPKKMGKFFRK